MVKVMLFRPSFCAHCGERIERVEWRIWTSRRFCEVCETGYKGQELIPRVIVGLGVLAGIIGVGSYFKSGSSVDTLALKQPRKAVDQTPPIAPMTAANANLAKPEAVTLSPAVNSQANAKPLVGQQIPGQRPQAKQIADDPMYYCGAATKKGTPCTRRVKGNVRCYQHTGMPAMLTAEKLRVK
jgi:hypothetical protein